MSSIAINYFQTQQKRSSQILGTSALPSSSSSYKYYAELRDIFREGKLLLYLPKLYRPGSPRITLPFLMWYLLVSLLATKSYQTFPYFTTFSSNVVQCIFVNTNNRMYSLLSYLVLTNLRDYLRTEENKPPHRLLCMQAVD